MVKEINLFVIWENARDKTEKILEALQKKFEIIDIYEISWSKKNFVRNLERFYGISLPDPKQKSIECGLGSFLLVLIIDNNPKFELRPTSNGMQLVNTNVYDEKMRYRKMLDGRYPIHSAVNQKEVNHNLTLILNKNLNDIKKTLPKKWEGKIKQFKSDIVGANGWKNIQELFYVLNSTSNYLIMRNFEKFPNEVNSNEHKDIDILTDEYVNLPYILNQHKAKENQIKMEPTVSIDGKKILFDIRYVGDWYYDERWSKNMLQNKEFSDGGYFRPSDEDYFYSLIYHMLIHKRKINHDYVKKLKKLGTKIKINSEKLENYWELKKLLDDYMKKHHYRYTETLGYRIFHNETLRLMKVGKMILKKEGFNSLIKATKGKIKRTIAKRSQNRE